LPIVKVRQAKEGEMLPISHVLDAAYLSTLTLASPYLLYRSARTGKYRQGLSDRFLGRAPDTDPSRSRLWFHAVSLGEVLVLRPLVDRLMSERPDLQVVLSTSTETGLSVAKERLSAARVFRSPLDFSWSVRRAMHRVAPSLLVLTELELWPNLLLEARRRRVPITVVNARVSQRSHRGYRRLRRVLQPALEAIQYWGAQSSEYADRIRDLLPESHHPRVQVTGSMKYDGAETRRDHPKSAWLRQFFDMPATDRVLVAGSTMEPEESILLDAWPRLSSLDPHLRLFLVPRHPERFDEVARLLASRSVPFVRRSRWSSAERSLPRVVLMDSVGELAALWGLADFGFVGGSLECRRGGQSMIEPAALGVPCCFGPNTWNFRSTVEQLLGRGAAREVRHRRELSAILEGWIRDPRSAREVGDRAAAFIRSQQGAVDRTWQGLVPFLPKQPLPWRHSA
jgi:3-deoxy-D-manno-octulosonic-acid transferase